MKSLSTFYVFNRKVVKRYAKCTEFLSIAQGFNLRKSTAQGFNLGKSIAQGFNLRKSIAQGFNFGKSIAHGFKRGKRIVEYLSFSIFQRLKPLVMVLYLSILFCYSRCEIASFLAMTMQPATEIYFLFFLS